MDAGGKIRVLIADDSAFMRKVLVSIISAEAALEVVGEARDGREAVSLSETLNPDVITMDINMPHVDGLQATEIIMSTRPRPIVIVSSESRQGADVTLKALELGAIDFVAKPSSGVDLDMNTVRDELVRKIRVASKVRVVRTAVRSRLGEEIAGSAPRTEPVLEPSSPLLHMPVVPLATAPAFPSLAKKETEPRSQSSRIPVVVLGASTGGPATMMRFVPSFPKNFPAAVILVQHMPPMFTGQFSQQLAEVAAMRVKEAEPNEELQASTLYVCPGSHHLRVTPSGRIALDGGPRINGYRPCIDVTIESVAEYARAMAIAAIFTGMGDDGSRALPAIKQYGGYVVAQDEATAVIFGMPQEAIKTGAVDQVLPDTQIYTAVEKRVLYLFGAAKVGAL
jgi:two-component system chemotaxis response regulator CheB